MSAIDHIEIRYRVNHADGTYGPWTYQTIKPDQTTFDIRKVTRNGTYTVQVRSVSLTGVSSDWAEAIHVVQDQGLVVAPPNSITVVGVADGVSVRWAVSGRAQPGSTYRVERAPDVAGAPGTWVILGTTKGLLWHDGVTDGGLYWYRVQTVSYSNDRSTYVTASTFSKAKTAVDGVAVDIQNPFFDAGDVGWTKSGGWAILNNLGLALSGTWVAKKPTGSSSGTLTNAALIPVNAGQRVSSRTFLRSASSANGTGAAGVEWLDVAFNSLGIVLGVSLTAVACDGSWQPSPLCQATAPFTARFCRAIVQVNGHTVGDWYCDNDYLYVDTSQIPAGNLTNFPTSNLWPNPTSEVNPPDGADLTTSEWVFRFHIGAGNARDGEWVRRLTTGDVLSHTIPVIRDEVIKLDYWLRQDTNVALNNIRVEVDWLDTAGGVISTSPSYEATPPAYPGWDNFFAFGGGRAPPGAVSAKTKVFLSPSGNGNPVDVDSLYLAKYSPVMAPPSLFKVTAGSSLAVYELFSNYEFIFSAGMTTVSIGNHGSPYVGLPITIKMKNASGSTITGGNFTWGTSYKLGTWGNLLTGFSRSITFVYDGTNFVECGRSGDIPN
jgi:hypothetical protein